MSPSPSFRSISSWVCSVNVTTTNWVTSNHSDLEHKFLMINIKVRLSHYPVSSINQSTPWKHRRTLITEEWREMQTPSTANNPTNSRNILWNEISQTSQLISPWIADFPAPFLFYLFSDQTAWLKPITSPLEHDVIIKRLVQVGK